MKKFLSILMVSALLLALIPGSAFALEDKIKLKLEDKVTITNADPNPVALTITNDSPHQVDMTVEVFDEKARSIVYSVNVSMLAGDAPQTVHAHVHTPLSKNGEINTYQYRVKSVNGFKRTLYFAQIMHVDKSTNEITYTQENNAQFGRNTVTSFGPQFRVLTPNLTKEWYMFTPIDLSIQGRQTVELVGGNMYNVGEVYVDVYGDTVNVTYHYHYEDAGYTKIQRVSEYLNFFPDYAAVHSVKPEDNPSPFAFGAPFSIANSLGGDTRVLMFVRNVETFFRFPAPKVELRRNLPKSEENMALRQHMLNLMDPMDGLVLINDHNYAAQVN